MGRSAPRLLMPAEEPWRSRPLDIARYASPIASIFLSDIGLDLSSRIENKSRADLLWEAADDDATDQANAIKGAIDFAQRSGHRRLIKIASRKSYLMTDENPAYTKLGKEFDGHGTVNHSANEYVRLGGFVHVNSAENYFSIFKRGVIGTFHHISEQHLHRSLAEFDFRYNNRSGLGVEDAERANKIMAGITGKRLTYRRTNETANA
jgi:ISXO2-like transposase domain